MKNLTEEITGLVIDYSQLTTDYNSSMHPEAIKYRRAAARMSNAIEGVILSEEDRRFMNSIPLNMPRKDFKEAVLKYIKRR